MQLNIRCAHLIEAVRKDKTAAGQQETKVPADAARRNRQSWNVFIQPVCLDRSWPLFTDLFQRQVAGQAPIPEPALRLSGIVVPVLHPRNPCWEENYRLHWMTKVPFRIQ